MSDRVQKSPFVTETHTLFTKIGSNGVPRETAFEVRTIIETCYTGIGFNTRNCWAIRDNFSVAVGYGDTREEAIDNARASIGE